MKRIIVYYVGVIEAEKEEICLQPLTNPKAAAKQLAEELLKHPVGTEGELITRFTVIDDKPKMILPNKEIATPN